MTEDAAPPEEEQTTDPEGEEIDAEFTVVDDEPETNEPDYKAHFAEYHRLAGEAEAAKNAWDYSKEVASSKKKVYDGKVEQLIEHGASEVEMPLFDEPETEEGQPEDWKGVQLSELDMKPATVLKFEKNEIITLGDLTDFQTDHDTFWVKDLKDFGPAAGTDADEAVAKFWEERAEAEEEINAAEYNLIALGDDEAEVENAIDDCIDIRLLQKAHAEGIDDYRRDIIVGRINAIKKLAEAQD